MSQEDAKYFEACGFVGVVAETGKEQTLEVHSGVIGHSSEVN